MARRGAARCAVTGIVAGSLGLLAGCSGPKPYVRPGFLEHPPRRVAVLPFAITYPYDLEAEQAIPPSHEVGRDVLRKTFYYALTPYGYEDLELSEVDEGLAAAWGPLDAGGWRAAEPQALGKALGADALVYGEISRLMHFTTPLYTETSLQASLRMVEAGSGEVLWRQRVRVAERGGALMKKGQVVDFLKDQARSFNPGLKFLRISDAAVRHLLKGFPNPPLAAGSSAPPASGARTVRLAVLPLEAKRAAWAAPAVSLREHLVASLQESAFQVLELQQIDAALKARGWTEGQPLPEALPLGEVARELGADAWLRGAVTKWGRTYLVVQSWVTTGMALELVDAGSGEVIWSAEQTNRRQAGILKGPTGYKSLVTAPLTGLRGSHLDRIAIHLSRVLASELAAAPAVLAYVSDVEQGKSSLASAPQTP
ncbi:MAG: DUF799 family lipoprotein [Candidatus Omnitrophica bacterium]|nr:DUF799 family lipoprotein [Candidatus Omnitrophota bacterium]